MPTTLVTGCSTGIGRATAVRYARGGHTVWASMRDPSGAEGPARMGVTHAGDWLVAQRAARTAEWQRTGPPDLPAR